MGYNTYTTLDLIERVELLSHVPVGNNTFTAEKLVILADRELQTHIIKQILSTRGGYYLAYSDLAYRSSGLYPIPSDCIAGTLENVELLNGDSVYHLPAFEASETRRSDIGRGYSIRGDYIAIEPNEVGVLRLWYYKRPNRLITTDKAAQISDISGAVITVSSLHELITVGKTIEIIGDQPPFYVLDSASISSISGTTLTLNKSITTASIGDWVALQYQTPVPPIPVEFRPLLEQRVVVKIYELQGYLDKMKAAMIDLKELELTCLNLITPRVKGRPKVINPGAGGFL